MHHSQTWRERKWLVTLFLQCRPLSLGLRDGGGSCPLLSIWHTLSVSGALLTKIETHVINDQWIIFLWLYPCTSAVSSSLAGRPCGWPGSNVAWGSYAFEQYRTTAKEAVFYWDPDTQYSSVLFTAGPLVNGKFKLPCFLPPFLSLTLILFLALSIPPYFSLFLS